MNKQELLEYVKLCYSEQLFAGTSGILSCYDHDTGIMVITPTSLAYELMTVDDFVSVRLADGEVVDGKHRPSSEWRLHAAIYRDDPNNIGAVIHTHSPYATSFAVNQKPIPVVLIEMVAFLGGGVPLAEFAIPGTDDVGLNAVKAMRGGYYSALLANHGVVTYGSTLEQAHLRAVYVEDAAKICSIAISNGEIYTIPDDVVKFMKNRKANQ